MLDTLWTSLGGGGGGADNPNRRRRERAEGHYAPPQQQQHQQLQSQRRIDEAVNMDMQDERQVAAAVEDGWFAPSSRKLTQPAQHLSQTPRRGPPPPVQTPESDMAVGGTPARLENRSQAQAHWAQLARSVQSSGGASSLISGGTNSRGAARGPPGGHGGASRAGSYSTRSLMRDLDLEDTASLGGGGSLGGGSGFNTAATSSGTQSRTNSTSVTLSDALLRGEAEVQNRTRRLSDTPLSDSYLDNDDQTMTSYQTGVTSAAGSSIFAGFDSTFGGGTSGAGSSVGGKSSVVMQRQREEMLAELRQLLDGTYCAV